MDRYVIELKTSNFSLSDAYRPAVTLIFPSDGSAVIAVMRATDGKIHRFDFLRLLSVDERIAPIGVARWHRIVDKANVKDRVAFAPRYTGDSLQIMVML
jgi:hypothetical protein